MTDRTCVSCQFCHYGKGNVWHFCRHPSLLGPVQPVSGERAGGMDCNRMRSGPKEVGILFWKRIEPAGPCGPQGRLYEERRRPEPPPAPSRHGKWGGDKSKPLTPPAPPENRTGDWII